MSLIRFIFFILGHTLRHPVELKIRSTSMLLVSWVETYPAVNYCHNVTLYQTELNSYNAIHMDMTVHNHYRFTHLDSCTPYLACVEIEGTQSFMCLSDFTGMDWCTIVCCKSCQFVCSLCPRHCRYNVVQWLSLNLLVPTITASFND